LNGLKTFRPGRRKIPVVACDDRESVSSSRRRDVTVFDRHAAAGFLEGLFLFSPHMGD
jgi:hypothetical protein